MKKIAQVHYVMDASVLLAVANNEVYQSEIPSLFANSIITTFNLAEAVNKMIIRNDADEIATWDYLSNFIENHYSIDDALSYEVIMMTKLTKPFGLSLGDKYCLALGKTLNLPVYTADQIWKKLEHQLGLSVILIR